MSLENRVETLEHELKILKNEIESTLLEIQNQVLVHYYPAFRAEDPAPSRDQLPFVEVPVAKKNNAISNATSNATSGKGAMSSRVGSDDEDVSPKLKANSPEPLPARGQQPAARFSTDVIALDSDIALDNDDVPEEINQLALSYLAKWVNESVEKIGKARTAEMIDSLPNMDHGTPAIMDALHQLLDLSEEEHVPGQVDTKDMMDVLLKFNKMLDQAVKVIAI